MTDKRAFKEARSDTRRAIRIAKDRWFLMKAQEAEKNRFSGKSIWRSIRDMQRGRRGIVPMRAPAIRDENGNPCTTLEDQQERWRRHFASILNTQSQFDPTEIERVKQRPVRMQMAELPTRTREELEEAIGKLKNGKAGGKSNILPEMIRAACCEEEFLEMLLELVHQVWKEGSVPKDWVDAVLIPIPKKGDLTRCDNWRGISLLDVVGKLVARVLQERLQQLAEEVLPESQCGFRKGRGCTDMIFTVRQVVEKSWEHRSKSFLLFIDLKKAYDSVPRSALWLALKKLGVPEQMSTLIKSFHDDMKAQIRLDGNLLEEFTVDNGLRQGCCMAPVLFNLYSSVVLERWSDKVKGVEGVGINVEFKMDEKLFRRYTRNADQRRINECQFADDTAFLATMRPGAEQALKECAKTNTNFGLTVSTSKTKFMAVGREAKEEDREPMMVEEGDIEHVNEFPYLGSVIAASGRMDPDIDKRITQASKAFGALRKSVFLDKNLSLNTKRKVYQACVLSVLLYGSECWIPLRKHLKKLDSFHNRCIRAVLGISNKMQWQQRITSQEVRQRWGDTTSMSSRVKRHRLEWLGHLARMPNHRIPKTSLFCWLPQPRPRGGPQRRWRDVIRKDLKDAGIPEDKWYEKASASRGEWRRLCRKAAEEIQQQNQPEPLSDQVPNQFLCPTCLRSFRRESDMKRHKCLDERRKPISEQRGAEQCSVCKRWFASRGGPCCSHTQDPPNSAMSHVEIGFLIFVPPERGVA